MGRRSVLATLVAVVLPLLAVTPASAQAPHARPLPQRRWHFLVQVDGVHGKDTVTITALRGFELDDSDLGTGRIRIKVVFDRNGFAETWQDVVLYGSVSDPWTPWLGATNLDHRPGKELLVGYTTGAHSQYFTAYHRAPDGELLELRSPLGSGWGVNASVGTGSSGWRCTRKGVELRAVSPPSGATAKWKRTRYVYGRNGWRRTGRKVRTVPVDSQGNASPTLAPPVIDCRGIPSPIL